MKKLPVLFERVFDEYGVHMTSRVTKGMEWVMDGEGTATMKVDGACCAIINGEFYKRYDAKRGKKPPEGAIPCCEPDEETGHWPHWVKCDRKKAEDKWFWVAYDDAKVRGEDMSDCTFEAIGKHFNRNPYGLDMDTLVRHGGVELNVKRTYEGIRDYLEMMPMEGIVFWKDGEPMCKVRREDFGIEWPIRKWAA